MAGSINNTVILFKLESTSGTDSAPTNTSDAVLITVSDLQPKINEQFAERDVITGTFSAPDKLPFARTGEVTFSVEAAPSGAAGTEPEWGDILQACGMTPTVTASTRVDYTPISQSLKTASIWVYYNGRLEKFNYCAGTFKFSGEVGKVPKLTFTFKGLVTSVAASSVPTPTLTPWKRAEAVAPSVSALSIGAVTYSAGAVSGGTSYNFKSFNIDAACDVQYLGLASLEKIGIYGRNPSLSLVADIGGTDHAAFKADMHAGATRASAFTHGSAAGKKLIVYSPTMVITDVSDSAQGSVLLDSLSATLRPSSSGNDDFRIVCL